MQRTFLLLASSLALSTAAQAQNEAALRTAFEGKLVSVKVGMPGTSRGIDVYPLDANPVDWREVAERVKDNGTALKIGDQVMVTKVVVKKNSHIEFQLGGGGWGTFFDSPGTSTVSTTSEGESQEERDLKKAIKEATGPTKRKELERELATARNRRERENARARAEAQQANAAHEANVRAKRAESGSRFNIRFRNGIPPESLTPEGLMAALGQFVDFNAGGTKVATASGASTAMPVSNPTSGPTTGKHTQIRKGLSVQDVEALLGPADSAAEEKQGILTVNRRSYTSDGMKVSTSFVNGVLIDFAITPK